MIDVNELSVSFGSLDGGEVIKAVNAVSFTVNKGESFGLVGESGCGKSTILRALAGLNTDYTGEVRVDGKIVERNRDKAFFRSVQMVFQDPYGSLHPRFTIYDQLMEPIRIHKLGDGETRVNQALDSVGLNRQFRFRYPHQLSGGQRQRVAIARTLILEPSVLLLDEPTSALDVSVQAEILNLLVDLQRDRGLTFLLVSHDLAVVAHMCERLAIMMDGNMIELLSRAELEQGIAKHPSSRNLIESSRVYGDKAGEPEVTSGAAQAVE